MYGWVPAWLAGGAMREPSRAWGASVEEIMKCRRWVGALVAVHPCGRQVQSHAETLQRRCKFERGAQRREIPMSALERLAQARAARERAEASLPTVEQQQAEIERTQRRAEEHGQVEKTAGQSGVVGVVKRAWESRAQEPSFAEG